MIRQLIGSSAQTRHFWSKSRSQDDDDLNQQPFPLLTNNSEVERRHSLDHERYEFTNTMKKKQPLSAATINEYKEFGLMSHARPAEQMIKRSTTKSSKRKIKSSALFKEYSVFQKHQSNFYFQLMRKIGGKSTESKNYLSKRKRKRLEFKRKLADEMSRLYDFERVSESYSSSPYEFNSSQRNSMQMNHASDRYSMLANGVDTAGEDDDDEDDDEYNYYTDSEDLTDDDEEPEQHQYSRTRWIIGAASPVLLSAGVGLLLAQQQSKKDKRQK